MTVTLGQPLPPDRAVLTALVDEIIASGRWSNDGPIVQRFEQRLAADLGWADVSATSSGTSALTVALLALDLPRGGEVITSALTFTATVQAIELAGLVPRFAAVDPETLCLDPDAVRKAITAHTVAILPVHLFGLAADVQLDDIGEDAGLPVVYDAAHAYGFAPVVGRGIASAYSLHATKLLHTAEGGCVGTDDPVVAARLRRARAFGLDADRVREQGTNAKMSEHAAALGLAVLPGIPDEIRARQRVRDAYDSALALSTRCRPHAPGRPRALVMEVVRCAPEDQQDLLDDLAAAQVVGRIFPALCAPGQRYADVPLVGAEAGALVALAGSAVALPLHGRVPDAALDAISAVLRG
ncbi:DegT/DnrJ/EryC1/StrS family aminotransferase [Aeromicrobium duanguangcaii]|uniref:DegT/DnrJ/EryC1/StrS family aminotransferase n=1 Tax=Aeromicrobium duanguangcaii TaxID=2968086 RepID=A0ABY5KCA3_9ACTN|nr:DegT/DnrJ/EryC1/StrS family aminotransferase [Aeromicrobium duanguangcaii]MCD9154630.1 DegT/DnrJ/EryC1/StrS family aminotransferase [Aeromicrobium duanguangcaii]UUI67955.1 DegT/DnrJ/EryC1/StrS family aminotransferase [Aeromicrobium duanguangcaii]